jgi:hypothetical protein
MTNWNFITGEMVHTALEWLYNSGDMEETLARIKKRLKTIGPSLRRSPYDEAQYAKMNAIVLGMLPAYDTYYDKDWDDWNIVATEVAFSDIELSKGVHVNGRIDMVIQEKKTGEYAVVEHKTRSRITGQMLKAFHVKTQAVLYTEACSKIFEVPVRKVYYNLVRKPELRQCKKESFASYIQRIRDDYQARMDDYFYREPVRLSSDRHARLLTSLLSIAHAFRDCRDSDTLDIDYTWPIEPAMCDVYGGCEFFQLCLKGASRAALLHFRTSNEIRGCQDGPPKRWQG